MTRGERIVAEVLGWLGLFLALAAAVIGEIEKPASEKWLLKLLTASILAMWPAIILFFRSVQKQYDEMSPYITGRISAVQARDVLRASFQSGTFGEGSIDSYFWLKYGEFVLNDRQLIKSFKPAQITSAIKESRVVVPPRISYDLMLFLFKQAVGIGEYLAIATLDELANAKGVAFEFLYEIPLQSPKKVRRIIALQEDSVLAKSLPEDRRKLLLKQLEAGVKLKYMVARPEEVLNFGVYGSKAVGELDEQGWNVVDFNSGYVKIKSERFNNMWQERCKDLDRAQMT